MKSRAVLSSVGVALFVAAGVGVVGCGKSVNLTQGGDPFQSAPPSNTSIQPPVGQPPTGGPPTGSGKPLTCASQDQLHWTFTQPQPSVTHAIDLLFVADTSSSMNAKRARVASDVSAFVNALPSGTDYRIGVMLAHGAQSSYSGKLYAASGARAVLDSRIQSASQIQSQLRNSLVNVPSDPDDANGEAMMASFQRSLSGSRFSTIRSQGLYRDDAALAVVFISDENDICYPPQKFGFTSFPDYVAAPTSIEDSAYTKNCLNSSGKPVITPESTLAALEALKPGGDFSVAGIVHVDGSKVPSTAGSEESIGHGIIELLDLAGQSHPKQEIALDIMSSDFTAGLSSFGAMNSSHLSLETLFQLDAVVDTDSVSVSVDQKPVMFNFDEQANQASIKGADAGGAGSLVRIDACRVK
ncbi:MAG: hypothetical protein ACJ763_11855 [Bdellovibrionia bacterium]